MRRPPQRRHNHVVIVIGGGIGGMAAAASLAPHGPVTVLDRGRRLGGRMASRTLRTGPWAGHVVDLGAAYLTVRRPEFAQVAEGWQNRGLLRPWTDTLAVADADGLTGTTTGLMRFVAPDGLRSLVEDLALHLPPNVNVRTAIAAVGVMSREHGWRVLHGRVDSSHATVTQARTVAMCLPGPQAARLLPDGPTGLFSAAMSQRYDPVLSLVAQWPTRVWDAFAATFVNGDQVLASIADDGDRRGDGAAVLVAHSTPELAAAHLAEPDRALEPMVASVRRILRIAEEPIVAQVKRWSYARAPQGPAGDADARFTLDPRGIGLAGDAFSANPRIEAAWASGRELGMALAMHL